MIKFYESPEAKLVEFDTKDVITTSTGSGSIIHSFQGEPANEDTGWTGLY